VRLGDPRTPEEAALRLDGLRDRGRLDEAGAAAWARMNAARAARKTPEVDLAVEVAAAVRRGEAAEEEALARGRRRRQPTL
jgi:hypothetical protein